MFPDTARHVIAENRLATRIPPGLRLLLCLFLSVLAFGARTLPLLLILSGAEILLALLLATRQAVLWRDAARLFLWQTVAILLLHLIRFGAEGVWPGFRTSWQLLLAFLPGMVFLRSVSQSRLIHTLNRIMPYRMAFVLSTSMRFIPLIIREVKSIYEVQLLRGARVLPADLVRPWNWPDLVRCVLVPAVIQSLILAAEIARSARARDFGIGKRRTYWPDS